MRRVHELRHVPLSELGPADLRNLSSRQVAGRAKVITALPESADTDLLRGAAERLRLPRVPDHFSAPEHGSFRLSDGLPERANPSSRTEFSGLRFSRPGHTAKGDPWPARPGLV